MQLENSGSFVLFGPEKPYPAMQGSAEEEAAGIVHNQCILPFTPDEVSIQWCC